MYQPAVSASLKKLRELAGDPLLVRSGAGMVPTDAGLRMIEPSASILRAAEMLFSDTRGFEPQSCHHLPRRRRRLPRPAVPAAAGAQIKAPGAAQPDRDPPAVRRIRLPARLAQGDIDVVIGNWLKPPEDLHLGKLFSDEIVCLVSRDHPPPSVAGPGRLAGGGAHRADAHPPRRARRDRRPVLEARDLRRNITARCPHFGLLPRMVASSLLVLTTGRQFCERYTEPVARAGAALPGALSAARVLPAVARAHAPSASGRWLRERVKAVAAGLKQQ
jgi:DNA-binding transcriptional LysR family regulator